jgi:hypothetical protein
MLRITLHWILPIATVGLIVTVLAAQDKPGAPAKPAGAGEQPKAAVTNAGFEKLKKLAGQWDNTAEPTTQPASRHEPTCVYKVVSAGTAIEETLLPNTPYEMITMYHLDGPDLVMTHYCALGNQPHMKAAVSSDPNKLEFRFVSGCNMDAAKDDHMHDLTLTFVDVDHVRAEWTSYSAGKPAGTKTFELQRRK